MSNRVCIIDLPGLSHELLSEIPRESSLGRWLGKQEISPLTPSWPALTCSVQATLTTGVSPAKHGIIGNGIATFRSADDQRLIDPSNFANYRREVSFWEQSNQLLEAPRFWNGKKLKTALLFFQNSMPGFSGSLSPAADIVITPKPEHGPDGKFTSLLWTNPRDLQQKLFAQLGPFPLMNYWGPLANIDSSRWIARAAASVWREHQRDLQFVYVPHLDYDLQRFGPDSPHAKQAVRDVCEAISPLVDAVNEDGRIVLLSEYAMRSVSRAAFPNRALADAGLLVTRESPDGPLIDYARSDAFAMCDHQIANVHLRQESSRERVIDVLVRDGVRIVPGTGHRRDGELVLEAADDLWFDYRWWHSPGDAPKFAASVDIHRKPGYDPLELFFDPITKSIASDVKLVKGSHGSVKVGEALIAGLAAMPKSSALKMADVAGEILKLTNR